MKKVYKPSGPDGKGWGDFRETEKHNFLILEEIDEMNVQESLAK